MSGPEASSTVPQGAKIAGWRACLNENGFTSGFFAQKKVNAWQPSANEGVGAAWRVARPASRKLAQAASSHSEQWGYDAPEGDEHRG